MYTIKIKIDGTRKKTVVYPKPMTIAEIIHEEKLAPYMIYKINNVYVTSDYLIDHNTKIDCLTLSSLDGYRIYQDTAIFIMMKAFYNLYGIKSKLVVEHSISDGIFCEIFGEHKITNEDAAAIQKEMQKVISNKLPIEKKQINLNEAEEIFGEHGRDDVLRNLKYRRINNMTVYKCGQYYDYYIRQLAENTSFIHLFEVVTFKTGIILRIPRYGSAELSEFSIPQKLFDIHQEYDKWLRILKMHNVFELNEYITDYKIPQIIHVEEALQEKKIARIADMIKEKSSVKIILIAGPSSSGKTTFAKRLAIQLQVNGLIPKIIGMDDYFLARTKTPRTPEGEYDFESIYAIDIELLNSHLNALLKGEEIDVPKYNFKTGMPEYCNDFMKLGEKDVLIMEGIHGLNDELTAKIPDEAKFRVYISALNQLNIDYHNRIPTTDSRKIRRIVRDARYRGYDAEDTLMRWDSIRKGEEKNIFPFQENADIMFNSSLTYELAFLKNQAAPLLQAVRNNSPVYPEAQRLLRLLRYFEPITDHFYVPTNSIVREFAFGSIFKY